MYYSNMQTQRLPLFSRTRALQIVALLWQCRLHCGRKKPESSKQSSKYEKEQQKCAFLPSCSVPVKFFTQGVMKTIQGVTNLEGSGLVRVVTRASNETPYNFYY